MKQELKLKSILIGKTAIEKFLEQRLPIKISFNVLKIANQYKSELELIENRRLELIKKFDPSGQSVPKELIPDFMKEWDEFLESETTTIEFKKINVDDFSDDITLTPDELASITYIFENLDNFDYEDVDVEVV